MKNIIYLLLLLANFLEAQQYNLIVSVQPCKHSVGAFIEENNCLLKKQDHIIQPQKQEGMSSKMAQLTGKHELKFKDLNRGQYTFQFTNFYNQKVLQVIDLQSFTKKIIICLDTFVDTHEPTFFEKLTPKDSLICEFSSSGCEHFYEERYKFAYENGNFIGTFTTSKLKIIRKILTPKDLAYLIHFEKQLRQMRFVRGGCTTRNTFIFHLNDKETLSIEDRTCRWHGEIDLKKKIFGIKSLEDD